MAGAAGGGGSWAGAGFDGEDVAGAALARAAARISAVDGFFTAAAEGAADFASCLGAAAGAAPDFARAAAMISATDGFFAPATGAAAFSATGVAAGLSAAGLAGFSFLGADFSSAMEVFY